MDRLETIKEMQMCLNCSPFFSREVGDTLAHQIGMHVKVWQDGFLDLNGERQDFQNEMCFGEFRREKNKKKMENSLTNDQK